MKIDFHIHTYHSYDSRMKPEKILKVAKARGLDGIVVCDHDTIKGGKETYLVNKDKDFMVIIGAEIATNAGDITGLYLTREIRERKFSKVAEEIKAQGGKIILNHPYKGHDLTKIDFSKIDFIEGYNSRLNEEDNSLALELAKKHNIPVLAGSDAHVYAEIGNCFSEITEFDKLIASKHTYTSSNKINVTLSQYIKAFKQRKFSVFYSATAVQIKHTFKRIISR